MSSISGESSIIAVEDGQLLHLVDGVYDDRRSPMASHIKHFINDIPHSTYRSHVLFEHVSREGLISITKQTSQDESVFIIRFQNWHGTRNADIICRPPATTHRNSICSASFDEENNRGVLAIADNKSRYFCLFQFPEDAEYWKPREITGDLGVTTEGWSLHQAKGRDADLSKRGFKITKLWMFTNDQTKNIRVTLELIRKNRSNAWWRSPDKIAKHYILSSTGEVAADRIGDSVPTDDNFHGYLLDDERIPHTISISPNKKNLFHVKPTNKEDDVELPASFLRSYAAARQSGDLGFLTFLASYLVILMSTLVLLVNLGFDEYLSEDALVIFVMVTLFPLCYIFGSSSWFERYFYSNSCNAFRFHGVPWRRLEVKREKFEYILDITIAPNMKECILILSTDGIHGYNLRDGKISGNLRHQASLTKNARFCPSTYENLVVVFDQNKRLVYEKLFMIEGKTPQLVLSNETEFGLKQLQSPDDLGRRFLEPYAGSLSIKSILMHAPNFQPARELNQHSLERIKLQKAFKLFGIDPYCDIDNILEGHDRNRTWELHDEQDQNMMTKIRNWNALFISKGRITVIGEEGRWVWDDEEINSHGLHWHGVQIKSRMSDMPCELKHGPNTVIGVLMSNIEKDWSDGEFDPWDTRRIDSIEGDHEECILHTMAKAMIPLYPRVTEKTPLNGDMIPNLIDKNPAIVDHIQSISPAVDIISIKSKDQKSVYSKLVSLNQFTLSPSRESETIQRGPKLIDWSETEFGERPFSGAEGNDDLTSTIHPLFLTPEIKIEDAHADLFGEGNTILPLKDHANVIAELMLLPCHLSDWQRREFTTSDLNQAFAVHYKYSFEPTCAVNPAPLGKVSQVPWLSFYEHLPAYHEYIESDVRRTLEDMNLSNTEADRVHAYANTILRGCTLEYFVLECLLALSKEKPYVQHADVINEFVENRLKDLLRDLGELRIPYDRVFNDRTSLVCLNQNTSLPALVLDAVSDLSHSFYANLMKKHDTPVYTAQGQLGKGITLRQWKNVNPHFMLVSNITGLIHQNDQRDYRSQKQIAFLLDRRKLLFHSNLELRYLLAQTEILNSLDLTNLPLLDRVDNHLVSPNLETLLFLWQAMQLKGLGTSPSLPLMGLPCFTSLMIAHFGDALIDLFYRLWNGEERSSGKARASKTEVFTFPEDMPATSYLLMSDEEASQNQPKQPSSKRDHTGNVWTRMRNEKEFAGVKEIAQSMLKEGLWEKGRTSRQHHMVHGDLYASNILLGGEGRLYLCDFSDTIYRREEAVYYRRDDPVEDKSYVSSHFFKRCDEDFEPRINAMADLAWFISTLLLKVPFEPQRNEVGDDVKHRLRILWDNLPDEGDERSSRFEQWFVAQLDEALSWADENLKDACYLTEGKDARFKHRLKAMVFDGCLRLMAFQYARSPDVANWSYRPEDVARCFGWNKPPEGIEQVREVMFAQNLANLHVDQQAALLEWSSKITKTGLRIENIKKLAGSSEIRFRFDGKNDWWRGRGTLVDGVLTVTSLNMPEKAKREHKKNFEWK